MKVGLLAAALVCAASGCSHRVALYCDENTPCTDPARPFCDLTGEFPASEDITNTCIPDPSPDAGPSDGDAGDAGPSLSILQLAAGTAFTCALLDGGDVRCWGYNFDGHLGYGHTTQIGDTEHPYTAGTVPVGAPVRQLAMGGGHTCALLEGGRVRCWGRNQGGQLGYATAEPAVGDNETPAAFGRDVAVGGEALQVVAGANTNCVLIEGGSVRCWGNNTYGELGRPGAPDIIGDNETPASQPPVDLGAPAVALAAGSNHFCALLTTGGVRCWGLNTNGACGQPTGQNVGDDETPASLPEVDVGGEVVEISAAGASSCARLVGGSVRCWGSAQNGMLGSGSSQNIGDNEVPAAAAELNVGAGTFQLYASRSARCSVFTNGDARCWGQGSRTGYGDGNTIGDNELPSSYLPLDIDRPVVKFLEDSPTSDHLCVLVDTGGVRCWGTFGEYGALGYANIEDIGDNEPVQNVDVQILDP